MHSSKFETPAIETDLLRLFLYQDQCPGAWKEVFAGPLKTWISALAPSLQSCGLGCTTNCAKFHPAVEEDNINTVALAAFARRWSDCKGKPAPPAKADACVCPSRVWMPCWFVWP